MKISLPQLHELKLAGTPIVMVTAYDHPSGRIVDQAGVDMVLVGDSAANTVLGHDAVSTVGATMDELLVLTRAVARACATNPVALVNPCHRVIASDGKLSGYKWGIERKKELLDREKRS